MRSFLTTFSLFAMATTAFTAVPDEDGLYAVFDTTLGDFTIELDFQDAPIATGNFVGLAEGRTPIWDGETGLPVFEPYYDGLIFHRVIEDFVIQGGDPNGDGSGGPGYSFIDEVSPAIKHDGEGILSMANSGPNTNGSQFFVTLDETPHLDGLHTVFGKVVDGIETVRAIGATEVDDNDKPVTDMVINSVRIHRVGAAAEAFNFRKHIFPDTEPVETAFEYSDTVGPVASFNAEELTRFAIQRSSDLSTWMDARLEAGELEDDRNVTFEMAEGLSTANPANFFQVVQIRRHQSLDLEGAKLVITSPDGDSNLVETITFGEDQVGTYATSGSTNVAIQYRWYEINENRVQVFVYRPDLANSVYYPYYQYFLDWDDEDSGSVYIHDSTTFYPGYSSHFIGEGTFEYDPD